MTGHIATVVLFAFVTSSSVIAQATLPVPPGPPVPSQPPARQVQPVPLPPPPPPAPPARPVRRLGQAVNVKVDVTVADQRGGSASLRKTLSVVTADAQNGFIRTQAEYALLGSIPLNVDVQPTLLASGKIMLELNLQYDLPVLTVVEGKPGVPDPPRLVRTTVRENLSLVLDSGKPMIAAQSADPVGDRQVTVEVTATILK